MERQNEVFVGGGLRERVGCVGWGGAMRGLFEGGRICEEFSAGYYGVCAVGGLISAGTTHLAITPFDVLKVHMQVCAYFGLYHQIWIHVALPCGFMGFLRLYH